MSSIITLSGETKKIGKKRGTYQPEMESKGLVVGSSVETRFDSRSSFSLKISINLISSKYGLHAVK